MRSPPSRRQVLAAAGALGLAGVAAACEARPPTGATRDARLRARPGAGPPPGAPPPPGPGTHALGLEPERDALLQVPPAPRGPLVVTLHGAGGDAGGGLALLRGLADERGLLLLAPSSRGTTWDAVASAPGPDVERIDRALAAVFAAFPVDAGRIAVAGFSDGASYALGLGLANGDLFGRVLAFSPGFVPAMRARGRPAVFVAHGTADDVLPIDRTSRELVPRLEDDGYDVTYREFDGPHVVPPDVAREAVDRLGWT
ncbi:MULTISPECIES: alpha/beta hydrolase [unclassified Blastococcus]